MSNEFQYDVLIIGSGASGLGLALQLPDSFRIAVLSKASLTSGSTYQAQGGVAAVLDDADSTQAHIQDTITAGGNLSRRDAVAFTVEHGKESIDWLIQQGVPFTSAGNEYHLTKEGGHSHRRIIHSADATGQAIQQTLIERARASSNIDLFEDRSAVDLITSHKLNLPDNR